MPMVKDILKIKGSQIHTISKGATALDAAEKMNDSRIGALVVVDDGHVQGIFTERDVLRRVVARHLDPSQVYVEAVMTKEVVCCQADTKVTEAQGVFKNRKIRHLPVLDEDDRIIGLISIGDLNAYQTSEQETTIRFLHEYLYGAG